MRAAGLYLATLGEPDLPALEQLLSQAAHMQLRGEAAAALGRTRRAAAAEPLLELVTKRGANDQERAGAAVALGHLARSRPGDPLVRISRDVNFATDMNLFLHELLDLF